jgi:acetyl esterase/lipase
MTETCCSRWFRPVAAIALVGALTAALPAQRLRPRDIDALPSKPADARIPYGPDESLQFGDLRLPKGNGPFPTAIVVHGGCWVSRVATLQNTAALADALRDAGVATWNIEYRTLGNGGGWPGTFADVGDAADKLRSLAEKYPLDLSRTIAIGHSSGGHLALWLAARARLPPQSALYRSNPLRLRAALALGGPGDLRDITTYVQTICGAPVVEQLLGGTPAQVPERYAQASPAELLPLGIAQVLIVGTEDPVMPAKAREAYVEAARRAGDDAKVITIPDASHFEPLAPSSAAWPVVRDAVLAAVGKRP